MKRLSIIPLAVLAVAPLTRITAQESPPVKVGDRVRVTAPALEVRDLVGTYIAVRGDTLELESEATLLAIPMASVTRLEVVDGRKSGLVKGGVVGLVVGVGIGVAKVSGCGSGDDCFDAGLWLSAPPLAGMLLGGVVGALIKTDRWREVPLDRPRVSFGPQRDGRFGFGASVRF